MNTADNTPTNNIENSDSDSDNYTKEDLFESLTNLNTGFDSPSIKHFSETDFRIIMNRCKDNKVKIYGIESFTTNGEFIDCIVQEMYDEYDLEEQNQKQDEDYDTWFLRAFDDFSNKMKSIETEYLTEQLKVIYSASYSIK